MTEVSRLADPHYLRFQYADDEKLRIRIETHERYSENLLPFRMWLLRIVDARPGQCLLDVGAGSGQFHADLAGVNVTALDISPGMLAKVTVPAVQADAQYLPFADASFDRVMANHVLYHIPDMPLALREMRRVVRPGGRVVITTNSRTTLSPLFEMADAVARELGVAGYQTVALRFGLEDVELIGSVFPSARIEVYEDAFRFTSPEPVLAYVASMWIDYLDPGQEGRVLATAGRTRTGRVLDARRAVLCGVSGPPRRGGACRPCSRRAGPSGGPPTRREGGSNGWTWRSRDRILCR